MKKLSLIVVLFLVISSELLAQTVVPFGLRYGTTQKGNIDFISNTIVHCDGIGGSGAANCGDVATNAAPTSFNSYSQNNDHNASYVDIDGDPATFNSSSDSLNIPLCSEVLFAEIYWGARRRTADTQYPQRNTIKIGIDGGAYTTITADDLIDNTVGYNSYHCRANITALVQANPIKAIYTIADMYAYTGISNTWGGWNIVVVYRNDLQTMRNLTVYDGLTSVVGVSLVDIPVTGFLTPPSGPVTFDIGIFGYDGDRGFTGDQLLFDGGTGFQNVSDPLNPFDDVFNSTSTIRGVNSTSQNPLFLNNLSYDADIFAPDNSSKTFIGNSATSATIRVATVNGEKILSQVITMAIDVFEPDIRASVKVQDLNGGAVEPGDTLEYTVKGMNIGSDPSINTYIVDTLEQNAIFVPGSINIIYGSNLGVKTDAAGDDEGEYSAASREVRVRIGTGANATIGGQVNNSPSGVDSTVFTFRVTAETECVILACDDVIDNSAHVFGTGIVSGNIFSNASNPGIFDINGCPLPGTTSTPINATACVPEPDVILPSTCNTTPFTISVGLTGYTYYDASFAVVTAPSTAGIYYGIISVYSGCEDTVQITVTSIICNLPPVAVDDAITIPEDTSNVIIDIQDNDSDPDGDPITTTVIGGPTSGGTVTVINGDSLDYSPPANFVGNDTLTYVICDGGTPPLCDTAIVVITINPVNDTIPATTPEDSTITFCADSLTTYSNGPATTVSTCNVPSNGTILITGTCIDYTPNNNFTGLDTLCVVSCNGLVCDTTIIIINVTPVNAPPSQGNETMTVGEDDPATTSIDLTTNNVDPDGTATDLTTIVSTTGGGTVTNNGDGTVDYTPTPGFNGIDTVIYTVCDNGLPLPVICVNDTLFVTVTPVNDPPVIDNEYLTTNVNNPVSGDLTDSGDFDSDGNLVVTTTPTSGPTNGSIVINSDGTFTYTPDNGFTGNDTVLVTICDDGTPLPINCTTDTIFIVVNPCDILNLAIDCDNDGVSNGDETNPPGGGTPTNPNDPCDYNVADVTLPNTAGADCDGDGVIDSLEIINGTLPNDPCDYNIADITIPVTSGADCDGDGVTDSLEIINGTLPNDPCDYNIADITIPVTSGADCDGDGVIDSLEIINGTLPNDPCDYNIADVTLPNIAGVDCDGDGVTDSLEIINGTLPNDPCDYNIADITLPILSGNDCDGDGIIDSLEIINGSDPFDPCSPIGVDSTDSDGDGLTDCEELTGVDDPNTPGVPSGPTDPNDPCDPIGLDDTDSDGDGLTDCEETTGVDDPNTPDKPNGFSDPFDPCSPFSCGLEIPEGFTPDGDGINDLFVIEGIENYPGNTILIFNRWGTKVYETSPYNNEWDGRMNAGIQVSGDELPTGTYFYILDTKDESIGNNGVFQGYVYLKR